MYDDEVQQAAADVELIKSVLARTTVSFSTLRPAFLGLAALWLVYALAETALWVFAINNRAPGALRNLGAALYRLLQLLPPAALFLFSRILKNRNITDIRRYAK